MISVNSILHTLRMFGKAYMRHENLLEDGIVNGNIERVADSIDHSSKSWKEGLITSTFTPDEAAAIRCIPLSKRVDVDKIVWWGENTGEYSVRRGYRTLISNQKTVDDIRLRPPRHVPDMAVSLKHRCMSSQGVALQKRFVIRNEIGLIVGSGAVKNDYISNSFSPGAIACIQALKFAEAMGFRQLEVEGDSQIIIVKINQGVVDRCNMVVYIEEIKAMATCFQRISFKHADKNANGVAHIIAQ
ncbi:hypothetical protein Gotur_004697 [Gossypium turneri]